MDNETVTNIEKLFPEYNLGDPLFLPESGEPLSFSAKHKETGKKVVLKKIDLHTAKAALRWKENPQDGIAPILEIREDGESCYLIREWVEGQSLLTILTQKSDLIGDFFILFCISSSLRVLSGLHSENILHGQLKPTNFFFEEGNLVLTDPCLTVNPWEDSDQEDRGGLVEQTAPHYQNPEWIKNLTLKPASDIYSIGTIFHHLLFFYPPFTDPNPLLVCFKHLNESPTIPEGELTSLQQTMWPLVYRMLAKDPDERPKDAFQCLDEFEKLASHSKGIVDIQTIKLETGKLLSAPSSSPDDKPILITESSDIIPVPDSPIMEQPGTTYIKTVALSRKELLASMEQLNPVVSEKENEPETFEEMQAVSEAETLMMPAIEEKTTPQKTPVPMDNMSSPKQPPTPQNTNKFVLFFLLGIMVIVCLLTLMALVYILLVRYNILNL